LGGEIEASGLCERVVVFADAFLLEVAELGDFLFAAAGEAGFLELEIEELLVVGLVGMKLDQGGALGGIGIGELFGKIEAALREESLLQVGDAAETPDGIGDRLREVALEETDGLEFGFISEDVTLVFGDVI
jgi:hypothetical protein